MKQPPKQSQLLLNVITGTSCSRTVWTIGHGVKSLESFQERLKTYQIDRVIDVRTKPYSRWHPQYNREQLAYSLAEIDINYQWFGKQLGGLAENVNYDETIRWVYELSMRT